MLKQCNGLYNIDYKIQVIQCNECHLERCLSGKCSNNALFNSNIMGYKLAFYRYRYKITMSDDFELCIARISQCELSDHQLAIVSNLSLLISVREGDHLLLGFTS